MSAWMSVTATLTKIKINKNSKTNMNLKNWKNLTNNQRTKSTFMNKFRCKTIKIVVIFEWKTKNKSIFKGKNQ